MQDQILQLLMTGGGQVVLAIVAGVLWAELRRNQLRIEKLEKSIGRLSQRLNDCMDDNKKLIRQRISDQQHAERLDLLAASGRPAPLAANEQPPKPAADRYHQLPG